MINLKMLMKNLNKKDSHLLIVDASLIDKVYNLLDENANKYNDYSFVKIIVFDELIYGTFTFNRINKSFFNHLFKRFDIRA